MSEKTYYKVGKIPIRMWAEADIPHEKLLLKGKASLSDVELLSIILRTGNDEDNAIDLAKKIIHRSGNSLKKLSETSYHDLIKIRGIGMVKALSIVSLFELAKRQRFEDSEEKKKINSSQDAYHAIYPYLSGIEYEEFYIILLNRSNRITSIKKISEGGMSGTVADPKKIFNVALSEKATAMILSHNHPSGSVKPSDADIKLTRKLKNAGDLLDLPVLDHIIVGDEKFYSFSDEGLL